MQLGFGEREKGQSQAAFASVSKAVENEDY